MGEGFDGPALRVARAWNPGTRSLRRASVRDASASPIEVRRSEFRLRGRGLGQLHRSEMPDRLGTECAITRGRTGVLSGRAVPTAAPMMSRRQLTNSADLALRSQDSERVLPRVCRGPYKRRALMTPDELGGPHARCPGRARMRANRTTWPGPPAASRRRERRVDNPSTSSPYVSIKRPNGRQR